MKNTPFSLENYQRPVLNTPDGAEKILLHSCCAPCSGEVIEAIKASGIEQTVFFYNPNIHPAEEYRLRKDENKRFCDKLNIPFIDVDYDTDNWLRLVNFYGQSTNGQDGKDDCAIIAKSS